MSDPEIKFPNPFCMNGRLYWRRSELESYKRALIRQATGATGDPEPVHHDVPAEQVTKEFGFGRKLSRPFFPIFPIELRQSFFRCLLLPFFRLVEDFQQASANRVFRPAQFLHPLLCNLGISELAQCLKQVPSGFPKLLPAWRGVYFAQSVGHRSAAAQRDAQVVHAIGVPIVPDLIRYLRDAVHPEF